MNLFVDILSNTLLISITHKEGHHSSLLTAGSGPLVPLLVMQMSPPELVTWNSFYAKSSHVRVCMTCNVFDPKPGS